MVYSRKGGDFMERREVSWTVSPTQGRVEDARSDPTHPLVRGRTKPEALIIAEIGRNPTTGEPIIDPVVFGSVSRMDAGE